MSFLAKPVEQLAFLPHKIAEHQFLMLDAGLIAEDNLPKPNGICIPLIVLSCLPMPGLRHLVVDAQKHLYAMIQI